MLCNNKYQKNEDKSLHTRKEKVARDVLCSKCFKRRTKLEYEKIFYDEKVFLHNINSWITFSSNDPTNSFTNKWIQRFKSETK